MAGSRSGPRDAARSSSSASSEVRPAPSERRRQAQLGRRHDCPPAQTLLATLEADGRCGTCLSPLWGWAALLVGAASLSPPLLRLLADRLAGHGVRAALGPAEVARSVALMALVWLAYGASLLLLVTGRAAAPSLLAAAAAFALAHAVGVLVVFAPAGVGAREAVLVALLAPVLGVPGAVAVALLSRVAHAVADFLLALLASTAAGLAAPSRHAGEPAGVRGR
ncbi:hypothetical protein [Nocardioides exalbidus]|uniref:hypothetical protein n=1 Tax=Nocardioides exalbidus TaxID=402596 RepID=UPI0015877266|nr:hypothetical protein [Nocardioides exalbidus]